MKPLTLIRAMELPRLDVSTARAVSIDQYRTLVSIKDARGKLRIVTIPRTRLLEAMLTY